MQSFRLLPSRQPPASAGDASRSLAGQPARSFTFAIAPLRVAVLLAAGLVAGCSTIANVIAPPEKVRGNRVDADILAELVPGTSSRADVTALLGSPTAKGSFDEDVWLYIGSVTKTRVARTQAVVSLDVVRLSFDNSGVLRGVDHLGLDDQLPVSVVERTTPSPGSDSSVMQQLFGNIGRFSAGGGSGGSRGGL